MATRRLLTTVALLLAPIWAMSGAQAEDGARAGATLEVSRPGDGHLGAGVLVHPGLVVTAAHVVRRERRMIVVDDLGRRYAASVLAIQRAYDFALLRIDPAAPIEVLPLACSTPRPGLAVTMVGHPLGRPFVRTSGAVIRMPIRVGPWPLLSLVDRVALPGMSGGPVIADGQVVALVVAATQGAAGEPGPAGAVPSSVICNQLHILLPWECYLCLYDGAAMIAAAVRGASPTWPSRQAWAAALAR